MRIKVNVKVDVLSESVIEALTGIIYATATFSVDEIYIAGIHKKDGWKFNWKKECTNPRRQIYRLTLREETSIVLGLISLEIKDDHVHVHLVESSPQNIGKGKQYLGIGGNLFAFACKISYDNGFDGNISFLSKTNLIEHYSITLGADHLGNGKMIIRENSALSLINKYFKNEK
jgi:hypothetical protein